MANSLAEQLENENSENENSENENSENNNENSDEGNKEKEKEKDDENIRGKYAGKYNTPEDLEKGYKEQTKEVKNLQKQLKEMTEKTELPEDFDIAEALKGVQGIPEGTKIDKDDVIFKHMMPAIRDAKLTPEQAKHLAAEFVKMQLGEVPDVEKEIASLGDNAKETLGKINKIIGGLPEGQADILRSFTTRADEIQTLIAFAEKYNGGEKKIPDNSNPGPARTAQELEDEAFEYRKKHSKTIGFNKDQQEHYNGLMKAAQAAKEVDKKKD